MQFPSPPSDERPRGDTSVLVLAGGASSRMGRPKALLPFADETLVERVVRLVSEIGTETIVAVARDLTLPPLPAARILEDEKPFEGPLLAIRSALRVARGTLLFVCACDQPFPNLALARFLLSRARGVDLVIPKWKGHRQPLFAVYRRDLAAVLDDRVAGGERSLVAALERAAACELGDDEVRRLDPEGLSFFDLDTTEDYAAALQRISQTAKRG